jgi:hypothetical protein
MTGKAVKKKSGVIPQRFKVKTSFGGGKTKIPSFPRISSDRLPQTFLDLLFCHLGCQRPIYF